MEEKLGKLGRFIWKSRKAHPENCETSSGKLGKLSLNANLGKLGHKIWKGEPQNQESWASKSRFLEAKTLFPIMVAMAEVVTACHQLQNQILWSHLTTLLKFLSQHSALTSRHSWPGWELRWKDSSLDYSYLAWRDSGVKYFLFFHDLFEIWPGMCCIGLYWKLNASYHSRQCKECSVVICLSNEILSFPTRRMKLLWFPHSLHFSPYLTKFW